MKDYLEMYKDLQQNCVISLLSNRIVKKLLELKRFKINKLMVNVYRLFRSVQKYQGFKPDESSNKNKATLNLLSGCTIAQVVGRNRSIILFLITNKT